MPRKLLKASRGDLSQKFGKEERAKFIPCSNLDKTAPGYLLSKRNWNKGNDKPHETVLVDTNSRGKGRNWRGRKLMNLKLTDVFKALGYKNSLIERISSCGEILQFVQQDDGTLKLYQAYFCKNKLCPLCNWRRSMKYSQRFNAIFLLNKSSLKPIYAKKNINTYLKKSFQLLLSSK